MENTHSVRTRNQHLWTIYKNGAHLGPYQASEVLELIEKGSIAWVDYAWRQGFKDWKRICDIEDFASSDKPPLLKNVEATKKKADMTQWFVFVDNTQKGPLSTEEIRAALSGGRLTPESFVWKPGLSGWKQASECFPDLKQKKTDNRRREQRKPIEAQLRSTNGDAVFLGICRDISLGGMQVLTQKVPGKVGDEIKLNVKPVGTSKLLKPFVAKGKIVRLLEDGRGFSFQFEKLSPSTIKDIEAYLK